MLTRETLKTLRKASRLCIYSSFHATGETVESFIDVYTENEQNHEFPATVLQVPAVLDKGYRNEISGSCAFCFDVVHVCCETVSTVLRNLKVGDQLSLRWSVDGGRNGYMQSLGLHGDQLYLKVYRKGEVFTYLLTTQVCPNNTARMIKGMVEKAEPGAETTKTA
jgi:hypothetical protein